MSIEALFRGYGVLIDGDDFVNEKIGGIINYNVRDNVSVDRQTTGGDIFASITSVNGHEESIEITSLNVDQVLDVVGTSGTCLVADSADEGFEFYLTKMDECNPGISALSNNMLYSTTTDSVTNKNIGLLYPGTLSIPHAGDASMSFTFVPKPEGSNAGIAVTNDVALVDIPDTTKRFGMGPVTINDTAYVGKQSVDINFGVSIARVSTDGDMFPSWVAVEQVLAVITIRGISPQWALAANIPRGGRKFTDIDTTIALRRKKPEALSGYFEDTEEEHILITANGRGFVTELASGNGTAPTQTSLVLYVERRGANAPLIVQTQAAISESEGSGEESEV